MDLRIVKTEDLDKENDQISEDAFIKQRMSSVDKIKY